jgi:hypothetical protein
MKRMRVMAVVLLAAAGLDPWQVGAESLPQVVPPGFAQFPLTDIKGGLIAPAGWHLVKVQKGPVLVYQLSPEKLSEGEALETGVTLNVHRDIPRTHGRPPSLVAVECLTALARKHKDVMISQNVAGPLTINRAVLSDLGSPEEMRVQAVFISNDRTGTLYTLVIETPARLWEKHRAALDTLTGTIVLDDEI